MQRSATNTIDCLGNAPQHLGLLDECTKTCNSSYFFVPVVHVVSSVCHKNYLWNNNVHPCNFIVWQTATLTDCLVNRVKHLAANESESDLGLGTDQKTKVEKFNPPGGLWPKTQTLYKVGLCCIAKWLGLFYDISKVSMKISGHLELRHVFSCCRLSYCLCQSHLISLSYYSFSVHYCHYLSLIYSNIKQPDPIQIA